MTVGHNIKMIRLNEGMSLEEFGQSLLEPATKGTVSKWENDVYLPNASRLLEIADIGSVSVEDILRDKSHLGLYIQYERKRKKMTLKDLADKSGTSDSYLSQLETGRRNPPKPKMLKRIAIGLSEDEHERKMHYSALMELAGYESEKREYSSTDLSHISTDDLLAEIKRRMK